nr:uncharacterized protein LOC108058996 [Drosophila takahashii]
MNRGLFKIWQFLILLERIQNSIEIKYQFILEDERIFTKCMEKLPETLDVNGLLNFTSIAFDMSETGVTLSGNATVIWDIQPTDRVQLAANVLYYERGSWQPTTLNLLVKDFCKVMFDKNQLWYESFSKNIKNSAEVKEKCFRVKGTRIIFETYTVNFVFGSGFPLKNGRYTLRYKFTAHDVH